MKHETSLGHEAARQIRNGNGRFIASSAIEGTPLYNDRGDRLGSIRHVMMDKHDGCARHAVVTFGGLFPVGERFYPLPWAALTYDDARGGYVVKLDRARLRKAPSYERGEEPLYDPAYEDLIRRFYGLDR